MIFGLNLTHTRGDIYRALLEGIACGTNHIIETYVEAGAEPRASSPSAAARRTGLGAGDLGHVGEGADRPRRRPSARRYGDAFLAALAVGDVGKDDIRNWNPVASEFVADPANADVYARQYAVFKDIYARTHDLMKRLHP